MNRNSVVGYGLGIVLLGMNGVALASPIQFASNGNWYELMSAPNITWSAARDVASTSVYNGMLGHLATITSAEENEFIFGDLGVGASPSWLGGFQDSDASEPGGAWQWVTGEAWVYSNWAPGEPNNLGNEDALAFAYFKANGMWNDAPIDYRGYGRGGYVVEYENNLVPEPTTMFLFGTGVVGLLGITRRKK